MGQRSGGLRQRWTRLTIAQDTVRGPATDNLRPAVAALGITSRSPQRGGTPGLLTLFIMSVMSP